MINYDCSSKSYTRDRERSTPYKLDKKTISQHTKTVLAHKRKMMDSSFPTLFQILFSIAQKVLKNLGTTATHFTHRRCRGKKPKINVSNKDLILHQFITKMNKHSLKVFSFKVHKTETICGLE